MSSKNEAVLLEVYVGGGVDERIGAILASELCKELCWLINAREEASNALSKSRIQNTDVYSEPDIDVSVKICDKIATWATSKTKIPDL